MVRLRFVRLRFVRLRFRLDFSFCTCVLYCCVLVFLRFFLLICSVDLYFAFRVLTFEL